MPRRHQLLLTLEPVAEAIGAELIGASRVRSDDIPLEWDGEIVGGLRLPDGGNPLSRMIAAMEADYGGPLCELDREEKQQVVAKLNERGAFRLRKAVEDVADALGVSRFTVYNYLNSRG